MADDWIGRALSPATWVNKGMYVAFPQEVGLALAHHEIETLMGWHTFACSPISSRRRLIVLSKNVAL